MQGFRRFLAASQITMIIDGPHGTYFLATTFCGRQTTTTIYWYLSRLPLWWHSLKSMVVSTLSVQICNLLVWKMWFQFAMWCIQHDLMQIKSISSKTTSHEQNLLSQTYKSLLQWRNSAKNMKFEKLWEPGQEKMHWKKVLNYYPWFCGNLYTIWI